MIYPSTLTLVQNRAGFPPMTLILDRYRIDRIAGTGGMGVVYKAEDLKLKRSVALKFLPPGSALEATARKRFIHEAQAAAGLMSPNICTIHEIHDERENLFISMEFVEGVSLREILTRGSMEISRAIDIAAQVAKGLQTAHKRGIIHRDIKSSNIMLNEEGQAKIMDFGLAKIVGTTILTRDGAIMGTAAYMSPEQARGDAIDERSDIWSLGVVLYEMLSGRLPFKGDSEASILHAVIYEEPAQLKDVSPSVPIELDRLVQRCLRKRPDDRFSSVSEIISELRRYAMNLRSEEQKTDLRERLFSSFRRPKSYVPAISLLIVTLLAGVWLLDKEPKARIPVESGSESVQTKNPIDSATASPEQRTQQEFLDTVSKARSALARRDPRAAAGFIEEAEKLSSNHEDLRSVKNEYQAALVDLERKLDDGEFNRAVRAGSVSSFQAYLDHYPQGRNATKARDLLKKLEVAVQQEESRIAEEKVRQEAVLDDEAFNTAKAQATPTAFKNYLDAFPTGRHASAARELGSFLESQSQQKLAEPVNSENAYQNKVGDTTKIEVGDSDIVLAWVPPGRFQMGSASVDAGRNEKPVHPVEISRGFWIGKYEVTQGQWAAVMGTDPIIAPSAVLKPACSVSWEEAQLFIKELNRMTGQVFRLPTEAEWEYACRAGAADNWYGEWNAIGWTRANSKGYVQLVGLKRPNAFGLYDMIGNVWEWCQDWYATQYYRESADTDPQGPTAGKNRVLRGGSFKSYPQDAHSAIRGSSKHDAKMEDVGFRVLLEEKKKGSETIFPQPLP